MPSTLHYASPKANAHFQTAGLLTADAPAGETLQVRCLLFYQGKHVSMEGKATTYSADKIREIADATNKWMAGGRRIKLYSSSQDHSISQSSTIGFLVGEVTAEVIDANSLPLPGLEALIGMIGIFGTVQLAGEANVQQYRDGRLKELSVGITPGNEIVEVSAVSIPSLAGAAMFAVGEAPSVESAIAHFHATLAYALTLSDQLQEDAIRRAEMQLWNLFDGFMEVLSDIRETAADSPDQLNGQTPEQLRSQAVEDYITQLRNRLQVTVPTPVQPLPTIPLFGASMDLDQAKAQIETLQAEKQASDRQVALFARRETLGDRFSAARQKAEALVQTGKMTPASFKAKFEGKTAPTIAQFAVGQVDQAEAAVTAFEKDCDRLEYLLEDLEANGVAVKFGLPVEGKDLDATPDNAADKVADDFLASYTPTRSY